MCTEFDPNVDRLSVNKVRRNFTMSNSTVLVHVEIELFMKGIIVGKESGEVSLKSGISQVFAVFNCAIMETANLIVCMWTECGYYYLFYSKSMDPEGFSSNTSGGTACIVRFQTIPNLYKSVMTNIRKEEEQGWFEIRKCDFTLSPIQIKVNTWQYIIRIFYDNFFFKEIGGQLDNQQMSDDGNKRSLSLSNIQKRRIKKRTTCYKALSGNCLILRGTTVNSICPVKRKNQVKTF